MSELWDVPFLFRSSPPPPPKKKMERPFRALFTTKVIKSHVKLQVKSDAQKLNLNCILATPQTKLKNYMLTAPQA